MTLSIDKPTQARTGDPLEIVRGLTASWRETVVERDRAGGSATAERDDLRASGLLSLNIPTRFGGWGADWPTTLEVVREIAEVDGSLAHLYGYHVGNAQFPYLLGTPEQTERYQRRIAEQDLWTGNASSESNSNVLHWTVTVTPTGDGGYLLNGRKHFTSGAKGSDLLLVFGVHTDDAHPEGAIISAIIPTDRAGVTVNDDWDAIGQRRTDSGTTDFHDARIEADEVFGAPNSVVQAFVESSKASVWTASTQLTFAYLYLGVAHGALAVAREYTRTQTRPWPSSGVTTATEDPYIIRTYGEFGIDLQAADAAARETARLLQTVWDAGDAVTPEQRGELMAKVSGVKALATRVSLDVTGRIFEVIGARGTHPRFGFDRFWRNVRTHTLHDPVAYKINEVGRYVLNGTYPTPSFYS